MIELKNVFKSFANRVVLRNVNLSIERGETIGLVGPSGGGKSVLLKLLGRVLEPDSGTVSFGKEEGQVLRTGFLFQEGALFDSLTVLENVAFPLVAEQEGRTDAEREDKEAIYRRASEVLEAVGLRAAVNKHPGQLSGGMRRRAGIARAVVARPELVLLDDPTGGLDPVAAAVIMKLIAKLKEDGNPAVVIVSHDIRRLLPNVDRVVSLFGGNLVADLKAERLQAEAPLEVIQFLKTRFDFETTRVGRL